MFPGAYFIFKKPTNMNNEKDFESMKIDLLYTLFLKNHAVMVEKATTAKGLEYLEIVETLVQRIRTMYNEQQSILNKFNTENCKLIIENQSIKEQNGKLIQDTEFALDFTHKVLKQQLPTTTNEQYYR